MSTYRNLLYFHSLPKTGQKVLVEFLKLYELKKKSTISVAYLDISKKIPCNPKSVLRYVSLFKEHKMVFEKIDGTSNAVSMRFLPNTYTLDENFFISLGTVKKSILKNWKDVGKKYLAQICPHTILNKRWEKNKEVY